MADDRDTAAEPSAPVVAVQPADVDPEKAITSVDEAKKPEDLNQLPHTPEAARKLAELTSDIKIPQDLSKVSEAKARELSEAGLVDDSDLPGKMYKRKADGFVARIPDYTFNAYAKDLQEEWDEIVLPTAEPEKK